jgi:hypothetical protein
VEAAVVNITAQVPVALTIAVVAILVIIIAVTSTREVVIAVLGAA